MKKIWQVTLRIIRKIIEVENLLFLVFILLVIFGFFNTTIEADEVSNILNNLIAASGIFSAIVIAFVLQGLNIFLSERKRFQMELEPLADKLTCYRHFLNYLLKSDEIWNPEGYYGYLNKLRTYYPSIRMQKDYEEVDEDDPIFSLINDNRYNTRTTRLYLAILEIVGVNNRDEGYFFITTRRYTYSLSRLNYIHEATSQIWYHTAHKKANVELSDEKINEIFKKFLVDDMQKLLSKPDDGIFTEGKLLEINTEFYEYITPRMYELTSNLKNGVPAIYKRIFIALAVMLIAGLIIPLAGSSFNLIVDDVTLLKLIVWATIASFVFVLYQLFRYVFRKFDV